MFLSFKSWAIVYLTKVFSQCTKQDWLIFHGVIFLSPERCLLRIYLTLTPYCAVSGRNRNSLRQVARDVFNQHHSNKHHRPVRQFIIQCFHVRPIFQHLQTVYTIAKSGFSKETRKTFMDVPWKSLHFLFYLRVFHHHTFAWYSDIFETKEAVVGRVHSQLRADFSKFDTCETVHVNVRFSSFRSFLFKEKELLTYLVRDDA